AAPGGTGGHSVGRTGRGRARAGSCGGGTASGTGILPVIIHGLEGRATGGRGTGILPVIIHGLEGRATIGTRSCQGGMLASPVRRVTGGRQRRACTPPP